MPDRLLEAKKGNNVARMCSAALTGGEKWGKRFPIVRYALLGSKGAESAADGIKRKEHK